MVVDQSATSVLEEEAEETLLVVVRKAVVEVAPCPREAFPWHSPTMEQTLEAGPSKRNDLAAFSIDLSQGEELAEPSQAHEP